MRNVLILVLLAALPALAAERDKPTVTAVEKLHLLPSPELGTQLTVVDQAPPRDLHADARGFAHVGLGLGAGTAALLGASMIFSDAAIPADARAFESPHDRQWRLQQHQGFLVATGAVASLALSSLVVAGVLEALADPP